MKKVSIIIPVYNKGKYVQEAVMSALNQTYQDIELVIIDDFSTDNSYETVKELASKYKNIILLKNNENKGVIYSRNTAIEAATGEYILPLDADDIIEPTYVEKAAQILDTMPEVGIVYCEARMFGSINKYWELENFEKSNMLYDNCIFCSALFRKKDFIKVGKYKDYMQYGCEDYDLWLSFIEQGFEVYRIDEILFNYRQFNGKSRTTLSSIHSDEIWRQIVKNHIDLYSQDKNFVETLHTNAKKIKAKHQKYKKLFNLFLILDILELIIIIVLI